MPLTAEQRQDVINAIQSHPDKIDEIMQRVREVSRQQEGTLSRMGSTFKEGAIGALTLGFGPEAEYKPQNLAETASGMAGSVAGSLPYFLLGGAGVGSLLGRAGVTGAANMIARDAIVSGVHQALSKQPGEESFLSQDPTASLKAGASGAVFGGILGSVQAGLHPAHSKVGEALVRKYAVHIAEKKGMSIEQAFEKSRTLSRFAIQPAGVAAAGVAVGSVEHGDLSEDVVAQSIAIGLMSILDKNRQPFHSLTRARRASSSLDGLLEKSRKLEPFSTEEILSIQKLIDDAPELFEHYPSMRGAFMDRVKQLSIFPKYPLNRSSQGDLVVTKSTPRTDRMLPPHDTPLGPNRMLSEAEPNIETVDARGVSTRSLGPVNITPFNPRPDRMLPPHTEPARLGETNLTTGETVLGSGQDPLPIVWRSESRYPSIGDDLAVAKRAYAIESETYNAARAREEALEVAGESVMAGTDPRRAPTGDDLANAEAFAAQWFSRGVESGKVKTLPETRSLEELSRALEDDLFNWALKGSNISDESLGRLMAQPPTPENVNLINSAIAGRDKGFVSVKDQIHYYRIPNEADAVNKTAEVVYSKLGKSIDERMDFFYSEEGAIFRANADDPVKKKLLELFEYEDKNNRPYLPGEYTAMGFHDAVEGRTYPKSVVEGFTPLQRMYYVSGVARGRASVKGPVAPEKTLRQLAAEGAYRRGYADAESGKFSVEIALNEELPKDQEMFREMYAVGYSDGKRSFDNRVFESSVTKSDEAFFVALKEAGVDEGDIEKLSAYRQHPDIEALHGRKPRTAEPEPPKVRDPEDIVSGLSALYVRRRQAQRILDDDPSAVAGLRDPGIKDLDPELRGVEHVEGSDLSVRSTSQEYSIALKTLKEVGPKIAKAEKAVKDMLEEMGHDGRKDPATGEYLISHVRELVKGAEPRAVGAASERAEIISDIYDLIEGRYRIDTNEHPEQVSDIFKNRILLGEYRTELSKVTTNQLRTIKERLAIDMQRAADEDHLFLGYSSDWRQTANSLKNVAKRMFYSVRDWWIDQARRTENSSLLPMIHTDHKSALLNLMEGPSRLDPRIAKEMLEEGFVESVGDGMYKITEHGSNAFSIESLTILGREGDVIYPTLDEDLLGSVAISPQGLMPELAQASGLPPGARVFDPMHNWVINKATKEVVMNPGDPDFMRPNIKKGSQGGFLFEAEPYRLGPGEILVQKTAGRVIAEHIQIRAKADEWFSDLYNGYKGVIDDFRAKSGSNFARDWADVSNDVMDDVNNPHKYKFEERLSYNPNLNRRRPKVDREGNYVGFIVEKGRPERISINDILSQKPDWETGRIIKKLDGDVDPKYEVTVKQLAAEGKIPESWVDLIEQMTERNMIISDAAKLTGLRAKVNERIRTEDGTYERVTERDFYPRALYAPQIGDPKLWGDANWKENMARSLVEEGKADDMKAAEYQVFMFTEAQEGRLPRHGNLENSRDIQMLDRYVVNPYIQYGLYSQRASRRIMDAHLFDPDYTKAEELLSDHIVQGGDDISPEIFKRVTGQEIYNRDIEKASDAARGMTAITRMGWSFLSQATQFVNSAALAGWKNTLKGLVSAINDDRGVAEMSGATLIETVRGTFAAASGYRNSAMSKWPHLRMFLKTDTFLRKWAANTGVQRINELAEALSRNPSDVAVREAIKELEIDPRRLLRAFETDAWKKEKELPEGIIYKAAWQFAKKTQFLSRPEDLPHYWQSPTQRMVTQFKGFSFMQYHFLKDMWNKSPTHREKMKRFTRYIVGASLAGEAVADIRAIIAGYERSEDPLERLGENMMYSGGVGIAYDVAKALSDGRVSGQDLFIGPTISTTVRTLSDVVGAVAKHRRSVFDEDEEFDFVSVYGQPIRTMSRLIPIVGNTLGRAAFPPEKGDFKFVNPVGGPFESARGSGVASKVLGSFQEATGLNMPRGTNQILTGEEQDPVQRYEDMKRRIRRDIRRIHKNINKKLDM